MEAVRVTGELSVKVGAPSDHAPAATFDAMVASSVPGPDPESLRSSSEYVLFTELEFDVFAFRNLMSTLVSDVAPEVVNDCANQVEPDAVLHAPSFIWVKRLVVPASARSLGALSPARAPRVTTAITITAMTGRTRMPRSLIFSRVIGASLAVQMVIPSPEGCPASLEILRSTHPTESEGWAGTQEFWQAESEIRSRPIRAD